MKTMKIYLKAGCLLLVLVFLVSGAGCTAQKVEKLDKIVLASPFSPLAMPMAYIVENNTLEDVAEDVELVIWNNPDQLRAMMTQGQAHFVSIPSNVASTFYNKGVGLKFLRVSIWGVFYIISEDTSVQSLHDLKGQEIYVPFRGDQPDLVFRYICQQQGIDPFEDFQIQYVSSPLDITLSMMAGQAKHALMLEPAAAVAIMKAKQEGLIFERVIDIQQEWGNVTDQEPRIPNAGIVALPNILDHPEAIEAFQKAYDEAVEWTNQNPHEAALLAAKHVEGVNAAAFEESLDYTIFESISAKDAQEELEGMFSRFMELDPASIGGQIPDDRFYYESP